MMCILEDILIKSRQKLPRRLLYATFICMYLIGVCAQNSTQRVPLKDACDTGDCMKSLKRASRIQYGDTVPSVLMPYMARLSIVDNKGDEYNCGGSLIAEDIILSAAHCFYDDNGKLNTKKIRVYLRDYSADELEDAFIADGVLAPSSYNPSKRDSYADIALVRLTETATTVTVKLPTSNTKLRGELIVAGYGSTENDDYSQDLLYATVPVLSDSDTEDLMSEHDEEAELEKDHFGAGDDDYDYQDSCGGDSGGPIIIPSKKWGALGNKYVTNDIVVGVVSYGYTDCGEKPAFGLYTEVKGWRTWISKSIKAGRFDPL